jgi:hypothetical protein
LYFSKTVTVATYPEKGGYFFWRDRINRKIPFSATLMTEQSFLCGKYYLACRQGVVKR